MQLNKDTPNAGDYVVRIHGVEIAGAIIQSADDETGEVWCFRLSPDGVPLADAEGVKLLELKTGTVTIRLRADEEAEAAALAAALEEDA